MKWFIVALAVSVVGCAKTFTGDSYECPRALLEGVQIQLKELQELKCPTPQPFPQP